MVMVVAALAACTGDGGGDVVGPFTGEVRRYVVDRFDLPANGTRSVADDLDGDGEPDNQLAVIMVALSAAGDDLTTNAPDMVASGALASSVEIQADDLERDDRVGVRYLGADGADAVVIGGRLAGGAFRSNRTRDTRAPGRIALRLPLFADADPVAATLEGVELELDPDGAGGFEGIVRGGIPLAEAGPASYASVSQMMRWNPAGHRFFARALDTDRDGAISEPEFAASPLVTTLLAADIQLFTGGRYAPTPAGPAPDALSVAFRIHLAPCAAGRCTAAPPADRCHDRARDFGETDVDCGGPCAPCPAQAACSGPADCQGAGCDAGRCRAPTCADGLANGFETDVDCGGPCAGCAAGARCEAREDCASGACTAGVCG
jgi:hypothetical protein